MSESCETLKEKVVVISTSFDQRIAHPFVDIPGIAIPSLTGNIVNDIDNLWKERLCTSKITSIADDFTYRDAITSDPFFDAKNSIFDLIGSDSNVSQDDEKQSQQLNKVKKTLTSTEEINQLRLLRPESMWHSQDGSLRGAELIPRPWITTTISASAASAATAATAATAASAASAANKSNESNGFTIMQFNMLADGLSGAYNIIEPGRITPSQRRLLRLESLRLDASKWQRKLSTHFMDVSEYCLQWRYRGLRVAEEILRYECDIVALEECDQSTWLYETYLKSHGYKMVFQAKHHSPCSHVVSQLFKNTRGTQEYQFERKKFETLLQYLETSQAMAKLSKQEVLDLFKTWDLNSDGMCIFYKEDRFELVTQKNSTGAAAAAFAVPTVLTQEELEGVFEKEKLHLGSFRAALNLSLVDREKPVLSEINGETVGYSELLKTAIGVLQLRMRDKINSKQFLCVVTHLKAAKSPRGEAMRVAQLEALFGYGYCREVDARKLKEAERLPIVRNEDNLPILLCTDMNAAPVFTEYECDAYNLMQSYGFNSMYKIAMGRGSEPDYTTWKARYVDKLTSNAKFGKSGKSGKSDVYLSYHTIDYIFCNKRNVFDITHYLDFPSRKEVEARQQTLLDQGKCKIKHGLLPDWCYPSDHFSLCLRMQWA